jgi:branched-chain amino acid transport system permease protein
MTSEGIAAPATNPAATLATATDANRGVVPAPASVAPTTAGRPPPRPAALPLGIALLLALLPLVASPYQTDLLLKVMVYAVFAVSLELLVGTTGLVSLGHAAFLGIGAYATVLASADATPGSALASVPVLMALAMAAAALYALVVGALCLRTQGVYFIMVTLAFAQMAYFVFHDTQLAGGSDGIYLNAKPTIGGWIDLDQRRHLYYTTLAALAGAYAFLALVLRSRFGRALAGIHGNAQRMRAAGFATFPYQLAAFVIAGALAGLAGFLLAVKDGVVNPDLLSWHESGGVLLMLILGGLGSLRGAVLGAVAFTLLKEGLSSQALVGPLADHWQLSFGLAIIAFVALLPKGLLGLPERLRRRSAGVPVGTAAPGIAAADD